MHLAEDSGNLDYRAGQIFQIDMLVNLDFSSVYIPNSLEKSTLGNRNYRAICWVSQFEPLKMRSSVY